MPMFDLVDGGVPATFTDGPKKGHVGVVDNQHGDGPPRHLEFMDGRLIYKRTGRRKVEVLDHQTGRPRKVRGVAYAVDKRCPFYQEVVRAVAEAEAIKNAGRIETL